MTFYLITFEQDNGDRNVDKGQLVVSEEEDTHVVRQGLIKSLTKDNLDKMRSTTNYRIYNLTKILDKEGLAIHRPLVEVDTEEEDNDADIQSE